jgi:peptide deformylase
VKLKIIKFPDPFLRKKAKTVKTFTPAIARLIDDMIETMRAAPGVGLAAPQVHKSLRVIVADPGSGPLALVNPRILERSGSQVFTEGCLCLPGVEAPVERAAHVKVKAQDRSGEEFVVAADGFLATILQHEIDHLEGTVFIDRVKDPGQIKYVPPSKEKKEELL